MKLDGRTLGALARVLDTSDGPLSRAVFDGRQITGFAKGRNDTVAVRFTGEGALDGAGYVGSEWLKRLAKVVGKKGEVEFAAVGNARKQWSEREKCDVQARDLQATVKGVVYKVPLADISLAPVFVEPGEGTTRVLDPADFGKAGAIAVAAGYAYDDFGRANLNAVHLDALVTATDGRRITRRAPVADLAGLDLLVPLDAIRAAVAVAQRAGATAAECTHYRRGTQERVCFRFTIPAGVLEIDSRVNLEKPPAYDVATDVQDGERPVSIVADDFRALGWPFRHDRKHFRFAIYEHGLLCWAGTDTGEIGTTLEAIPEGEPLAALDFDRFTALAKLLPDAGRVTVNIAPKTLRFGDDVFATLVADEVPSTVAATLQREFGIQAKEAA